MAGRTLALSSLVAVVATLVWRGKVVRNTILPTYDLPIAYYSGGAHETQCNTIRSTPPSAMTFCEDARFWDRLDAQGAVAARLIIIACDPGRLAWNTVMGPLANPDPRGALWLYDPSKRHSPPRQITFEGYPEGHDFHPLGFDILPARAGQPSTLFTTNHARAASTIEQFALSWDKPHVARWVRTLESPHIVSPNAIAAVSPTSFYVTQDHYFTRRIPGIAGAVLPLAESLLGLPLGWVTHVRLLDDPASQKVLYTVAAAGVPFANGMALSRGDGDVLAVAATSTDEVFFYKRDPRTDALTFKERVELPFATDNVDFDYAGTLVVAGHPHFPSLADIANNVTGKRAPSWVMSLTPITRGAAAGRRRVFDAKAPVSASRKVAEPAGYDLQTLYQSNGTAFSSSSTGMVDDKTGVLYVTGLYDEGMLVCTP
ncbi:hypothetical protein FA95DRAFT_1556417 [Auriscalpium vulgare]|uniref:Uncharacterized protein n=1 Tax=Auriscalpium vulgare TaxID=40419 RepID=A0ACB8S0V5_9AGAM|nr:hypothetical protein FA95DRAFT_1556417 [Auriscalpium vulgare]